MAKRRRHLAVLIGVLATAPAYAWAVNPVSWQVDISVRRGDEEVSWISPTALTPGIAEYDWSFEITEAEANGFIDLLEFLDETSGAGTASALPFEVINDTIHDETTGSSATINIGVDQFGVGRASATDITLGSISVPIFGNIDITRVDLTASVFILGVPTGDYDRDGDVDGDDFQVWKANYGSTTNLRADGNRNNVVDAADYTLWREHLGVDTTAAAASLAVAVPEPATLLLLALAGLVSSAARYRQVPS